MKEILIIKDLNLTLDNKVRTASFTDEYMKKLNEKIMILWEADGVLPTIELSYTFLPSRKMLKFGIVMLDLNVTEKEKEP